MEKDRRLILCRYCHAGPFNDYKELAIHILTNKKGHRGGLLWARRYMSRQRALDRKVSMKKQRSGVITEEDAANKISTRRHISGENKKVTTVCLKGKHAVSQSLPLEYVESPEAWRAQGRLVVACDKHRRERCHLFIPMSRMAPASIPGCMSGLYPQSPFPSPCRYLTKG